MAREARPVEDVVGRATRAFWGEIASQTSSKGAVCTSIDLDVRVLAGLAQDAFWASVAAHFPGASGDLAPLDVLAITHAAEQAVNAWRQSGDAIEADADGWTAHAYVMDFELAAEVAVTAWVDANVDIGTSTVGIIGDQLVQRSRKLS